MPQDRRVMLLLWRARKSHLAFPSNGRELTSALVFRISASTCQTMAVHSPLGRRTTLRPPRPLPANPATPTDFTVLLAMRWATWKWPRLLLRRQLLLLVNHGLPVRLSARARI